MTSAYEQAVLGSMMLDATGYWQVADLITSADFGDERHASIYETIQGLCKDGKPVDPVTMMEVMPEYGHYLIAISGECTPSSIKHYADEVRKEGESRRVKLAGQRIASGNCSYTEAQRLLADVAPRNTAAVKHVRVFMKDALSLMQKRCDENHATNGLPTGLDKLDEMLSGLQTGLVIVAARPSMGKTALALQIAVRTALRKKRVLVFEMEMTGTQLSERAVSAISGIDYGAVRKPRLLQEDQWPRIVGAFAKLEESSLIIDESGTQNIESICARARQQHMQEPLSAIVIDHLGLMDLPGKGSPVTEIGNVTKALKALAKDLDIPVICLVQLNRKLEERGDKRPLLSDLRDSGRIEEDADVVLMIYRDEYYNEASPHRGYAELLIRKSRDGETGMVPLRAKLNIMRFESCEGLPHVESKPSRTVRDFSEFTDRKTAAAGGN